MADNHNHSNHSHLQDQADEPLTSDVATKSLSDALQISFVILKVIMAVLLVLFIASGVFRVQYNERALVLHFGKIRGETEEQRILKSGLHWAWPSPIDEIVKIPVTQKQALDIDTLWYYVSEQEKISGRENRPSANLDPLRDGYCLTRNDSSDGEGTDYSIVHSKWKLIYTIENVEDFFRNVYYKAPKPGEEFLDVMGETVNPLLESMTSDAIVTAMVNFTIDEAISHSIRIAADVEKILQEKLDRIESGIVVESVQPRRITWPRQVNDAFDASNKASQQSRKLVTEAESYAEQKLNEAGGINAEEVLEELKKPNLSRQRQEELFSMLTGNAQEKIAKARAYRTEVLESAKANARYHRKLLPEYRKNPDFILQNVYQNVVKEILTNADEKMFVDPGDELRIMINRDPSIKRGKKDAEKETENNSGNAE